VELKRAQSPFQVILTNLMRKRKRLQLSIKYNKFMSQIKETLKIPPTRSTHPSKALLINQREDLGMARCPNPQRLAKADQGRSQ
jgi:hypothetical protein